MSVSRTLCGQRLPLQHLGIGVRSRARASHMSTSASEEPIKYPIPPFTEETALEKTRAAQV